ncbi:MAG: alpha/beta fold hydrolase [Planctomycetes bacterium]|nr:alpha/beta fold hydrolase [Planctomycetota bacterium]
MSLRRRLLLLWLALLAVSHSVWWLRDATPPRAPADRLVPVNEVLPRGAETGRTRCLVYRDDGSSDPAAPVVLLLHGSPGGKQDFRLVGAELAGDYRLVAPDLPGFGGSRQEMADYSVESHARYCLQLLDAIGVESAHVVGFSMGGGVGLCLTELAPERVRSLTLVSAIGAQELELFGSYRLNHAVHGAQLLLARMARWLLPHFGAADGWALNVHFARNFTDTDQRPLRGLLAAWRGPALVLHGKRDFLVPLEAAVEHHRLMPQSELELVPEGSHFLLWTRPEQTAASLRGFIGRVEAGEALTRDRAAPERLAEAALPFDPGGVPAFSGAALLVAVLLIALATLISEDLTCIAAGLLVSQGRIGFAAGCTGCFLGILFGDVLLYVLGRALGRKALAKAPMRWWIRPAAVERASAYFRRQGWRVVIVCRFLPGFRVPTYFAAGALKTHFGWFLLYFVVAVAAWTPVLVGVSAWIGEGIADALNLVERYALPAMGGIALFLLLLLKLLVPLCTWRGRRGLVGGWRRKRHFEFWPRWAVYLPLTPWFLWLALRHRSLRAVTAVNPAIPVGGLLGESKSAILEGFGREHPLVARWTLLPAGGDERMEAAAAFLERHGLGFPVVVKPDVGARGQGVEVARDEARLRARLAADRQPLILQEHVPGEEFGMFYVRHPDEQRGRVTSVTDKRMAWVRGDGSSSLERLILADPRAVALARVYCEANADRLDEVPAAGEEVVLGEIGAHSRGAIFLDGSERLTPAIEQALDRLSKRFEGFHFGRYDLRVPDAAAFARGEGFRVIELNGLTSEPTHLYDRRYGVLHAWRLLARTWETAWAIGSRNCRLGARPASWSQIINSLRNKG